MSAALFRWISDSALADWVVDSPYTWPALESIHFVSLCVLFGGVMMIDLRLIGFFRAPCAGMVAFLVRLSLCAFAVNLATGVLFFFGNTYKYVDNPAFELKLLLILAAGGNALFFKLRLGHIVEGKAVTTSSIAVGYLSLLFWSGVIICGRMITFYAR
jgi:hypothetical protein